MKTSIVFFCYVKHSKYLLILENVASADKTELRSKG